MFVSRFPDGLPHGSSKLPPLSPPHLPSSSLLTILPPPAQLRLHLSPATEAPTPADPLLRLRKRRKKKILLKTDVL
ncbi:hypothetical protein ILYODFUR_023929 [Ilyodon furcidens]|uniref:Uncharacterized protein n=1 Tax=Ilyodon furcidens TaxID=33524 RepID=A0ABV0TXM6_9TELE